MSRILWSLSKVVRVILVSYALIIELCNSNLHRIVCYPTKDDTQLSTCRVWTYTWRQPFNGPPGLIVKEVREMVSFWVVETGLETEFLRLSKIFTREKFCTSQASQLHHPSLTPLCQLVPFNDWLLSIVYFSSLQWFTFELFDSGVTSSAQWISFYKDLNIFSSCCCSSLVIKLIFLPHSYHLISDSTLSFYVSQFCSCPLYEIAKSWILRNNFLFITANLLENFLSKSILLCLYINSPVKSNNADIPALSLGQATMEDTKCF